MSVPAFGAATMVSAFDEMFAPRIVTTPFTGVPGEAKVPLDERVFAAIRQTTEKQMQERAEREAKAREAKEAVQGPGEDETKAIVGEGKETKDPFETVSVKSEDLQKALRDPRIDNIVLSEMGAVAFTQGTRPGNYEGPPSLTMRTISELQEVAKRFSIKVAKISSKQKYINTISLAIFHGKTGGILRLPRSASKRQRRQVMANYVSPVKLPM